MQGALVETISLIEGELESITSDGQAIGWARLDAPLKPARIQISLGGMVAGAGWADIFRPDLAARGKAHWHYGFNVRLRHGIERGRTSYTLKCGDGDAEGITGTVLVPPQTAAKPLTVEQLLDRRAPWTVSGVLSHPEMLDLPRAHEAMGAEDLVKAVFRFALSREADPGGLERYRKGLDEGEFTAEGLLVILLNAGERSSLPISMPPPYDPDFPFVY